MEKQAPIKIAIFCENAPIINNSILPILNKLPVECNVFSYETLIIPPQNICLSDYSYLFIHISTNIDQEKIKQHLISIKNILPVYFLYSEYSLVNKDFIFTFPMSGYFVFPLHEKELHRIFKAPFLKRAESIKEARFTPVTFDIQNMDWFNFFTSFTFDGILIHDNGIIIDINDSLVRISGYSRDELIGENIIQLVVCNEFKSIVHQNIENETHIPYEIQINIKGGERHWVELQGRTFLVGDKNYRIVAVRDIHKEKTALLKLKETTEKIQGILDHTYNFIGLLTTKGVLIDANQTSLKLIKAKKQDVINKPFCETPWWQHSKRIQIELNEAIKKASKGEFVRFETTHIDAYGKLITIDYSLKPVVNEKNEVIYIIPEGRDISIYKRAQQLIEKKNILLQDTEKRLEKTNKKLNDLNKELILSNHNLNVALGELSDQQAKYYSLFEYSHDAIILMDEKCIIDCNKKFVELFNITKKEIIGETLMYLSPEYQKNGEKSIDLILRKTQQVLLGESFRFNWTGKRPNGDLLETEIKLGPIYIQKRILIQIICKDLTDQIKSQKELSRLQNLLTAAIEQSPSGILIAEAPEGKIKTANKTAVEILGPTNIELTDIPLEHFLGHWQLFTAEMQLFPLDMFPLAKAIRQGVTIRHEKGILLNTNGEKRWVSMNAAPIKNSSNEIIAGILIFHNITDLIESEQALIESEKKFRTLAENAHDVIMRFDEKHRHLYVNPAVERETGIPAEKFIGKTHEELGFPEYLVKIWNEALKFVFQKKVTHRIEFQLPKGMWIDWTLNPEFGENNEVVAVMTSARDISVIKNAEEELKKHKNNLEKLVDERTREIQNLNNELISSNEELRMSNEALEEQKKELQHTLEKLNFARDQLVQSEKMASLGVLTAGIAHEINNPINFINSGSMGLSVSLEKIISMVNKYTHTLNSISGGQYKPSEEEGEELHSALKATQRMQEIIQIGIQRTIEIINSLRSFSRMDSESVGISDIHELLDNTLIILYHQYKDRISIEKKYGGEVPFIECIQSKINQVFMNMLINAIQAIPDKGKITIQTSYFKNEDAVKISIKDTGTGISNEIKDKIFDPFFTTKNVGKGTGLGLSIVYGIVQQHFGDIEINTDINSGTEFIITLPAKSQRNKNESL